MSTKELYTIQERKLRTIVHQGIIDYTRKETWQLFFLCVCKGTNFLKSRLLSTMNGIAVSAHYLPLYTLE